MKTILVPTDFSANAEHALNYAIEINKKLKGKILLYHFVAVPVYATDILVEVPSDDELKKGAIEGLEKIISRVKNENPEMEIAYEAEVDLDFLDDKITNEEKKNKADLVIMGTSGGSGIGRFMIGSYTANVIEKSICPIIAVPEKASISVPSKIVLAINYGEDEFSNIFSMIDFARLFNAEIILLHISQGNLDKNYEYAELDGLTKRIQKESMYPHIIFKLLEDKDVYDGLNLYLDEIAADMIAISMRERSFRDKIFNRSLTKKMVYHTHIPLMAFHTNV